MNAQWHFDLWQYHNQVNGNKLRFSWCRFMFPFSDSLLSRSNTWERERENAREREQWGQNEFRCTVCLIISAKGKLPESDCEFYIGTCIDIRSNGQLNDWIIPTNECKMKSSEIAITKLESNQSKPLFSCNILNEMIDS